MPPAAPGVGCRATPAVRAASSRQHPLDDGGRPSPPLAELGGVAGPSGGEVRPPASLAPRYRGQGGGDLTGLDSPLHQIVGHRDVNAGALPVGEQHRDRALMTGPECIHERTDLVAIAQVALIDVQLDVAKPFHVARRRLPARAKQFLDPPLELAILLQQGLDPLREVLRLRLERPGRSEEHTSELQSQSNLVCRLLLEKKKKRKIHKSHIVKLAYDYVKAAQ